MNSTQSNYRRIDTEEHIVIVRLSDGKNRLYNVHTYLASVGFTFNKRSAGNSFYEKEMTEEKASDWETFAKKNKLNIDIIPKEYMRSTDYRDTYFKNNRPVVEAKYRCAYCGKKIPFRETTIDHIFPINKLCYDPSVRKRAARWGINGANEEKNLVTACKSCNSKKGTKMGIWIYKGFLGKSESFWIFRKGIRILGIIAIILLLSKLYIDAQAPNTFADISSIFQFS